MFKNGRKTIGLIIGETTEEYQQQICHAMQERAEQLGYNLAIFVNYGHYGISGDYYRGALDLFELPSYDKLAGLVLAFDTYNMGEYEGEVKQLLMDKIRNEITCPVVSLREELVGVHNILLDEKTTMEGIIRHVIEEHGAEDVAFMTGYRGRYDAEQRLLCFRRIMKEHGYPVSEDRVFYGNFWKNMGKEACDHFFAEGKVPDAVICANDHMALAVIGELHARGIRVPEDVIVTGYDGLEEGMVYSPALTTVKVDFRDMAYKTVDLIHRHQEDPELETLYARTKVVRRESCGCFKMGTQETLSKRSEQFMQEIWNENLEMQISLMSIEFSSLRKIDELHEIIGRYIGSIEGCREYFICFREDITEDQDVFHGYTEKMHLRVGMRDGEDMGDVDFICDKSELLPAEVVGDGCQCYYFTPIHYEARCFGYEAYKFQKQRRGVLYLRWNIALANAIENILTRKRMGNMIQKLEAMYIEDVLTGLFNRRGFEKEGRKLFQRAHSLDDRVAVIAIDMDGLKQINDIFGHQEGDFALQAVADAINAAVMPEQVGARIGGDEFEVIFPCENEGVVRQWVVRFEQGLEEFNQNSQKPYEVHASWGYKVGIPGKSDTIESYMRESDDIMYQNKVVNKARRKKKNLK